MPKQEPTALFPAAAVPATPQEMISESLKWLAHRGVTLDHIAALVVAVQRPYFPDLTAAVAAEHVKCVLAKREVYYALITGITLDILAEAGCLPEPLQSVIKQDEGLYGIDEVIALAICNIYGSIGLTNFGYLDKTKPFKVGQLNSAKHAPEPACHTYLDDLISAVAAAAASRLAHQMGNPSEPVWDASL